MSIPEQEKPVVSSEQASEIKELDEKNIEKVSGGGLGGMVEGARSAMFGASATGGSKSQIIRAGIEGAIKGASRNKDDAMGVGVNIGRNLVGEEGWVKNTK